MRTLLKLYRLKKDIGQGLLRIGLKDILLLGIGVGYPVALSVTAQMGTCST